MTKFYIENDAQVTNYSPEWEVRLTKQEILDEFESEELTNKIRHKLQLFTVGKIKLSTDQSRRINSIFNEK